MKIKIPICIIPHRFRETGLKIAQNRTSLLKTNVKEDILKDLSHLLKKKHLKGVSIIFFLLAIAREIMPILLTSVSIIFNLDIVLFPQYYGFQFEISYSCWHLQRWISKSYLYAIKSTFKETAANILSSDMRRTATKRKWINVSSNESDVGYWFHQ